MLRLLKTLAFILFASQAAAQTVSPQVVKEIAPEGKLRAAINFGDPVLAQKDATTGEPRGISADLSRELARRLGVPVEFVPFEAAGKIADAARAGVWDIAFLAIDPGRANDIAFTAPYVVIEGTYLVPAGSPLRTIDEVDREGVRIAVGKGSAYDLYLTRAIKRAQLVRAPTSPTVIDVFRDQKLETAAGVRQQLIALRLRSAGRAGHGRAVHGDRAGDCNAERPDNAVEFLKSFVEDAKASGFVADALTRSNQRDAAVAPPAR